MEIVILKTMKGIQHIEYKYTKLKKNNSVNEKKYTIIVLNTLNYKKRI
jgi:predicted secreted protein